MRELTQQEYDALFNDLRKKALRDYLDAHKELGVHYVIRLTTGDTMVYWEQLPERYKVYLRKRLGVCALRE